MKNIQKITITLCTLLTCGAGGFVGYAHTLPIDDPGQILSLETTEEKFNCAENIKNTLVNTAGGLALGGLQISGDVNELNFNLDIKTYYKDESPSSSFALDLISHSLTDFKLQGINSTYENLKGEISLKDFTGGIRVNSDDMVLDLTVEQAQLMAQLTHGNIYFDLDNNNFKTAIKNLLSRLETQPIYQEFSPEGIYFLNSLAEGRNNKLKINLNWDEEDRNESVLDYNLLEEVMKIETTDIYNLLEDYNIYDIITYKTYRNNNKSIDVVLSREFLKDLLDLEDENFAALKLNIVFTEENLLSYINIVGLIQTESWADPIFKHNNVHHRIVKETTEIDVGLYIKKNPIFETVVDEDYIDAEVLTDYISNLFEKSQD